MGGVGRHRRHGKKSQCRHTNTLSLTVAYLDLSVGLHIVRENNRLVRNTRPPLHEGGSADRRADRLRSAQQQYAASLAQLTCDAAGDVPQCSGRRSREAVLRKDVSRFSMYKVPVVSKEDSTSHQSTCNANCILPGTSNAGVHKKKNAVAIQERKSVKLRQQLVWFLFKINPLRWYRSFVSNLVRSRRIHDILKNDTKQNSHKTIRILN